MLVDGRKGGQIQVTKTILEKIAVSDTYTHTCTTCMYPYPGLHLENISSGTKIEYERLWGRCTGVLCCAY